MSDSTVSETPVVCDTLIIRDLGRVDYEPTWLKMKAYAETRTKSCPDEIWMLEHPPVFTQGQAGKEEHLLMPGDIPVVQVDRGGQVTYHGPGQLVGYLMIDVKRLGIGVRQLVSCIENGIVKALAEWGIEAAPKADAPGVYVGATKIASLGLRIRRGSSYHGLALNINMDLEPFHRINPCGYQGLEMVQMCDLAAEVDMAAVSKSLYGHLADELGYVKHQLTTEGMEI